MNIEDDKNTTNAIIAIVDEMCVFSKKYDCAITCDLRLLRKCAINGVCRKTTFPPPSPQSAGRGY